MAVDCVGRRGPDPGSYSQRRLLLTALPLTNCVGRRGPDPGSCYPVRLLLTRPASTYPASTNGQGCFGGRWIPLGLWESPGVNEVLDVAFGAMDSGIDAGDELEACLGKDVLGLVDGGLPQGGIADDPL